MNLYLIVQDEKNGYDTYSGAVVAAKSAADASTINPAGENGWSNSYIGWASTPANVVVTLLCTGYKGQRGVILSSFHAG